MSRVYSSSKQKSLKELGIKNKGVKSREIGSAEQVQQRAYEIYQERIRTNMPGDMISDWVKAEQEVNSRERKANRQA